MKGVTQKHRKSNIIDSDFLIIQDFNKETEIKLYTVKPVNDKFLVELADLLKKHNK